MKKIKRFSILLLIGVLMFSLLFSACGTGKQGNTDTQNANASAINGKPEIGKNGEKEEVQSGTFYTMQEAYDNGLLTVEDIAFAADLHANKKNHPDPIDEAVKANMLKAYAKKLNADPAYPCSDYTAEDIMVEYFYGTYNQCTVVYLYIKGKVFRGWYVPCTIEVAESGFEFSHYERSVYLLAYYEG